MPTIYDFGWKHGKDETFGLMVLPEKVYTDKQKTKIKKQIIIKAHFIVKSIAASFRSKSKSHFSL